MVSVTHKTRVLAALTIPVTAALVLAGCASDSGGNGGDSEGSSIIVGTTDKVTFLDPAGSYDNGSFAVMNQVFPFLLNSPQGTADVEPDIAESAEFNEDGDYVVTLKSGLKFANGNELTSSDVKFSFDRVVAINAENGPWALLGNLDTVETPDDTTVIFHLKNGNDQTFPQVLSSPAGPIVDEETFSADEVTSDDEIVKGEGFAGPYTIESYKLNELVTFAPNPEYKGVLGAPKNDDVTLKYYADSSNLKLDVQEGNIDVAYRSLSATDIADLGKQDSVKIVDGPGGELRYIVFNFDTMPYGAKTGEADPAKALAVRQAIADVVDRAEIATQVYKDTYTPVYSFVPQGLTGATEVLKDLYGDGDGGPDVDKAKATLEAAGVTVPVELNLQYNPDHYGESSADEYALVKDQLDSSGLFTVNLGSTEWTQYSKDRTADVYPLYQLGWFPDYSDADNYLTPFFATDNFLLNHYSNAEVDAEISEQQTEVDADKRQALIEDIQAKVAADLSTLPLLQGAQVAVVGKDISGAQLDGSFKFRFGSLTKG
ncbi:ABC transporter substrate-binding protein [Homoserinibacter gongjuensis]|uniref:Peptide ABC transporter substrate-binding protein n=1 Tax=Homoserinibacter gongjuensis TaxID=1162968 RepID=A0ABQ6JZV8_9MICO|nr:ABC transporter substrate-binding protein [Homoserinibacter gongjuensis]GMA92335.1 peptide ABC transporter substrate-binding protein [Homoserinibacter gongjuensis]